MATNRIRRADQINQEYRTARSILKNETEQQIRAEYTTARDIIQKRIKRVREYQQSGHAKRGFYDHGHWIATPDFDISKSEFYQVFKDGVPTLRDFKNATSSKAEELDYISKTLADMKYWLRSSRSTMKGVYENTKNRIRGLRNAGYRQVNLRNIHKFGEFMKEYRARKLDNVVGSPTAVELYYSLDEKLQIPEDDIWKDFIEWSKHESDIREISQDLQRTEMFKGNAEALRKELFGF